MWTNEKKLAPRLTKTHKPPGCWPGATLGGQPGEARYVGRKF